MMPFFYSCADSAQDQCFPSPLPSVTEQRPSLWFPTVSTSILDDQGPPPLVAKRPLPQNVEAGNSGQVVVSTESFATTQSNCSSPQILPPRHLQSIPLNLSPTDFEAPIDHRVPRQPPLLPAASPGILTDHSHQCNPPQSHSVEDSSSQVIVFSKSFASTRSSCSSPLSSPPSSPPLIPLNVPSSNHEALADSRLQNNRGSDSDNTLDSAQRNRDELLLGNAKDQGNRQATRNKSDSVKSTSYMSGVSRPAGGEVYKDQSDDSAPDDCDTIVRFTTDNSDEVPTMHSSNTRKPEALAKRRRSSSPISARKLGSKENPIDVDKVASLFEPVLLTREYVWTSTLQFACAEINLTARRGRYLSSYHDRSSDHRE